MPVEPAADTPSRPDEWGAPAPAADHHHAWQLRGVEFDDGVDTRQFECASCDAVWFT